MSTINFDNFFPDKKLAFVDQPSDNEEYIIVPATFVFPLLGGWPVSQGKDKPALLIKNWPHIWPIEKGFLRLRLSLLNQDDDKNFCVFNMKQSDMCDYIESLGNNITFEQKYGNETLFNIVNGMIEGEPKESLHRIIWTAFREKEYKFITTCKSVFCLVPASIPKLIDMGIETMTDTKMMMWNHKNKDNEMVHVGWENDYVKIPCVDMKGLSHLYIQPTEEAYHQIFNTIISPSDNLRTEWIKDTVNRHLSSHDAPEFNEEEMKQLIKSVDSLYSGYQ